MRFVLLGVCSPLTLRVFGFSVCERLLDLFDASNEGCIKASRDEIANQGVVWHLEPRKGPRSSVNAAPAAGQVCRTPS